MNATQLTGIRVYWSMVEWTGDMLVDQNQRQGVLTTDHPQSCYGSPVLVDEDGTVYGPAELPPHVTLTPIGGYPVEFRGLKTAAIAAGYRLA